MPEQPLFIISLPAEEIDPAVVVSGAILDFCRRCGTTVWTSPATRHRMAAGPTVLVCTRCVRRTEVGDANTNEEQLRELEAHLGRPVTKEEVQEVLARLKRDLFIGGGRG